jgi:hypothetical protein
MVILILGFPVAAAEEEVPGPPAAPADEYKALLKAYQAASSGGVLSDEERMRFVGSVFKLRSKLALKFVELAEKNPRDPIAVDALIQAAWQVNTTPWPAELVGQDDARTRAFALLERRYIESDRLGPLCRRISFGFCKEYETFLRAVLERNPHREVQAQACLALAHYLSSRLQRLELVMAEPALAKEFEDLFGKGWIAELRQKDRAEGTREAEAFFEQAVEKYGDVKMPEGDSVGEKAKAELFEIRHLVAGKEAPEIQGEDQDGKQFKLSDYRGKVVLLDFWQEY